MDLDDLQKPNIGKPEFATGRSTGERKMWAIVTTIAFALFWFSGLFLQRDLFGQQTMHWSAPVLAAIGLAVGTLCASEGRRGLNHFKSTGMLRDGHAGLPRLRHAGTKREGLSDVLS
jgi:hypothetical protein